MGNWQQAVQLKPILSKLWMVGGSHTQRELFKQIYQSAAHYPASRFSQLVDDRVFSRNHPALNYQAS